LKNEKKMRMPFSNARIRQLAPLLIVLVSVVVAVAAYLQALHYPFVYDDTGYTSRNSKLAGLPLSQLWRLFTEPYNEFYEFLPLRELSYWLDMTLFGLNPSAFRLDNIILYLLCLPLVYGTTLWLWRYFRPTDAASAPWAVAAVTALFALHPSHAEAVVWIAGRKDVLSTLFSLLALWLAMCARLERGLYAPYAAATLAALLAAILSKASAVAVAPVIAILWMMFWRDIPTQNRRSSLLLWPLASLLLAACTAMIFAALTTQRIPFYFGVEVVIRVLAVLGWLARLSVSPESRHFFYPVFDDPYLPAMIVLGVFALAAALAGVVMMLRKRSLEGFALVTFLLLCLPSLQLVPYAPPSLVSDRWLALAVWPVLLLIVALAWRLKPMPRAILMLVIALAWSYQTIERTRDWRSFDAMVDADIRAFPGYYMPAFSKMIGSQLPHGLRREAIEIANSITDPEFRDIMNGMIKAEHAVYVDAVATGKPQEAIELLWQLGLDLKKMPLQAKWNPVIYSFWGKRLGILKGHWDYLAEQFPDDVSVRYNAGLWMLNTHMEGPAVANLRAAVESRRLPESLRGTAFKNLGLALIGSGAVAEAEAPLRAALEQSPPDFRAHCLLSGVYKRTGRIEEAARAEADCRSRVTNGNQPK
jgi:hypothetical protein